MPIIGAANYNQKEKSIHDKAFIIEIERVGRDQV